MTRRFQSRLAPDLERFLVYKRALGCAYRRAEFTLRSFDRYVATHGPKRGALPLEDLLRNWLGCNEHRKPRTVAGDLAPLRAFCRYRRRTDPRAFVPGPNWTPLQAQAPFTPHPLSLAQVRDLLAAAATLKGPALRARTCRLFLLLLYCTGLRPGEPVRLTLSDVDLRQRVLWIRESKGKTRLVPFRGDLEAEIRSYLRHRAKVSRADTTLLVDSHGHAYSTHRASDTVRCLLRRIGLKPARGRAGPRAMDLRHTFAVHRLTRWQRARVDIQGRLPLLSAYMGHDNLLGTETYLHATAELLGTASHRFQARFRGGCRSP